MAGVTAASAALSAASFSASTGSHRAKIGSSAGFCAMDFRVMWGTVL